MKVLHIIPSVAPCRGGPSTAVVELVRHQRQLGIDAEIACTNDNGDSILDVELNSLSDFNGVPVRFFSRFSPPLRMLREFAYSRQLSKWLKKHVADYDMLHVHAIFSYPSSRSMHSATRARVPYVVRPIGQLQEWSLNQSYLRKQLFLRLFEKKNLINAEFVHCTSSMEASEAQTAISVLNTRIIPLGISLPNNIPNARVKVCSQFKLNAKRPMLLFLGRLHPKKGLDLLLKALADINADQVQLLIAGSGDDEYEAELVQLMRRLNLETKVHFIGFIDGDLKQQVLQAADLFVLTSYAENFGISVLEAMASGTVPIVSTGVALSETINKHKCGFVCEMDEQAISACLRQALTLPIENLKLLGDQARQVVSEHFSWEQTARQCQDHYLQYLPAKPN